MKRIAYIGLKVTFLVVVSLVSISANAQAFKEVEYDFESGIVTWQGQANYVPCGEPFILNIIKCPLNATDVTVDIYSSINHIYDSIKRAPQKWRTLVASKKSPGVFTVTIPLKFEFGRYYYIDVYPKTFSTITENPNEKIDTISQTNIEDQTTVLTIKKTTTKPSDKKVDDTAPVIITTIDTIRILKKWSEKIYAIPAENEKTILEFNGSIGAATFWKEDFKSGFSNFAFVTGLNIHLRAISTNARVGRYKLYKLSRYSFVLGAVVNDLKYKSSDITAAALGLKFLLGGNVQFGTNGKLGLTVGVVFGNQDTKSKFNSYPHYISGLFIGISLSDDIFKSLKSDVPASNAFPIGSDQK